MKFPAKEMETDPYPLGQTRLHFYVRRSHRCYFHILTLINKA